jgi:hypothetical protein
MDELTNKLFELNRQVSFIDKVELSVSKSNVGWHISHSLKAIIGISRALKKSNFLAYKWQFNLNRVLVLTTGIIPRRKGKSPKSAEPEGEITIEKLRIEFLLANELIHDLKLVSKNSYFNHPYFGDLNMKSAKLFMEIHTNHHLKIIKDIVKSSTKR